VLAGEARALCWRVSCLPLRRLIDPPIRTRRSTMLRDGGYQDWCLSLGLVRNRVRVNAMNISILPTIIVRREGLDVLCASHMRLFAELETGNRELHASLATSRYGKRRARAQDAGALRSLMCARVVP
jgi:hypothetical protein